MIPCFSSPLAALAWWSREMQRHDGLRASAYDPRLIGPINGPLTAREDRLLLLSVIGCCLSRTPRRLRRALVLAMVHHHGTLEVAAQLRCSERWARALIAEGRTVLGTRLRRVGIVSEGS